MVRAAVAQRPFQGAVVEPQHAVEEALHQAIEAAVPLFAGRLEDAAAKHRREGQGNESGDQNGHADGDGEFVEQAPEDPAHEEERDEDGRQREGHGKDGEADLLGAVEGGLELVFAHFQVADDVFEHDDGIVHHKPDAEGQRHEGEVVEAVAHQVHDRKGADDGHGQGEAGNESCGNVPEKQKNDHDHEAEAEIEGEFDVGYGFPNGFRAVIEEW